MNDISEIQCTSTINVGHYNVQWKIENYSFHNLKKGEAIKSPIFKTGKNKVRWSINLYPEGTLKANDGFISIFLKNESKLKCSVNFEVSLLNKRNERVHTLKAKKSDLDDDWGHSKFLEKEKLFNEQSELLNNDTLVIDLKLVIGEGIYNSTSIYAEIDTDLKSMSTDYQNLLNSSLMSDFSICVKNRTFKVHKTVLAARSAVFAAMFSHNLSENLKNTMDIQDVDPDVMEVVIQYMYSGKCDKLEEMAQAIVPVSDKYCLGHLKSICERALSSQLNSDNIIPIVSLAATYNLEELKENCLNFISLNGKTIFQSSEWERLASQNKDLVFEVFSAVIEKVVVKGKIEIESS